jgi:hypothetical protein
MVRDFDDNEFPLAYFISFRCYGTWLHGDERGSMNRKQNQYGTPRIPTNQRLETAEVKQLVINQTLSMRGSAHLWRRRSEMSACIAITSCMQ